MQELTLVKDITVILVVAGAVTLLFRWLRQPPILGYLVAGLLVGPYMPPISLVTDVQTISHIADLGLVLVFFSIGLEFSWSKVRSAGGSILFIGILECIAMVALGYWVGLLIGLSQIGALFLGNAMQITSSAIISKIFRDSGKLNAQFARLVLGALLVEDIISIAVFALLTEFASTGTANLQSLGIFSLHLVVFIVVLVVLGSNLIPKAMRFTQRFQSKEALLITSLALCFASAFFGQYLGLSIAIGAFIMGSLIGDTQSSSDVNEVTSPVRQMFAAIFFVTMGMLIDVSLLGDYVMPAVTVVAVFITGKILINTVATFLAGYDGRTALNVGMSMPQMGEFSLVIMKAGVENAAVASFLYPLVALCTAVTCFITPYLIKASDAIASFMERCSPLWLRSAFQHIAARIQAFHAGINQDSVAGFIVRHAAKTIGINLLVIALLVGLGTFALQFLDEIVTLTGMQKHQIGMLMGITTLVLCLPSFIIILKNLSNLVDEGIAYIIKDQPAAQRFGVRRIQTILRHGFITVVIILIALSFIPFVSGLISHATYEMIFPILLTALVIYIGLALSFSFHSVLERALSRAFLGKEHQSATGKRVIRRRNNLAQKFRRRINSIFKRKK
ncbi:MAG: cation:proton antiporter [Dehalococcoidia bacterium]|nr:cation:proton antiporter [Dehalococcoidia bacterium]